MIPACSGNSSTPQPSTTSTTAGTTSAPHAHGAFEQCLTEHGVPARAGHSAGPAPDNGTAPQGPPPGPGATPPPPPGVDQTTWDNAMSACRSLAPAPPEGGR
jgi:hypothetical protein